MDNLTRDCILARRAGMSYGKWKAAQPATKRKMASQTDGGRANAVARRSNRARQTTYTAMLAAGPYISRRIGYENL